MPVIDPNNQKATRIRLMIDARRATRTINALVVATVAFTFATGCAWKGERADGPPALTSNHWSIRPVNMRVFPSTRFVEVDGRTMLESRIEMTDEAGDTTKAVGHFHFELFRDEGTTPAGTPAPAGGKLLYSWDVPMITLAQNREFFDSVTRTYLCRLTIDEPAITRNASMLRVTFRPTEGDRLTAQSMIEAIRRGPAK